MRIIDADRAKEIAEVSLGDIFLQTALKLLIDKVPTIDAVPVVHGQMEEVEIVPNYMWRYQCSCCHSDGERWYKYCPNCGAKMDGEWNGNETV